MGIGLTLFFCLTSLGLFVVWDTTLEAAARIGVSERIYRSLVEGAPDCVSLFDQEGRFLAVNPNGWRLLGLPAIDILGLPLARLWPQEQRQQVEEAVQRVLRGKKTSFEIVYQHPSGTNLGWQIILNPIQEADGSIRRFVGIISDVTERQRAEAGLKYRLELEALIARISTDFINLPSAETGPGINRALETLGSFVGVDRAYVFQMHDHGRRASNIYEWCASGVTPELPHLQSLLLDEVLPWFTKIMRKFEVCCIPRVADLPPEAVGGKGGIQATGHPISGGGAHGTPGQFNGFFRLRRRPENKDLECGHHHYPQDGGRSAGERPGTAASRRGLAPGRGPVGSPGALRADAGPAFPGDSPFCHGGGGAVNPESDRLSGLFR